MMGVCHKNRNQLERAIGQISDKLRSKINTVMKYETLKKQKAGWGHQERLKSVMREISGIMEMFYNLF